MTDDTTDYAVVGAMLLFGGGFITTLAKCWQAADPVNRARLKAAFAPEFDNYRVIARQHQTAEAGDHI